MKLKFLIVFGVAILGIVPFSLSGSSVYANETFEKNESLKHVIKEKDSLITRVYQIKESSHLLSYNEGENVITEVQENDGTVIATEISNEWNGESLSVTRTDNSIIVEKRELDQNNEFKTIQEIFPIIREIDQNPIEELATYAYYSAWIYTGLAVGKNVFSTLVNIGVGALVSFTASVFAITANASKFLLGYMGAYGLSAGAQIANILDSNGNGWIGLHKREVRNYQGGPIVGYQHRTY